MTKAELQQHLYHHGQITGLINGEYKQFWGIISEIEKNCLSFIDHDGHFHIFYIKDVKTFIPDEINVKHKYHKVKCDCGHKSEDQFRCEVCGKTFCGDCGHQSRKGGGNKDLCTSCLKTIKVLNAEKLSEEEIDAAKNIPLTT